MARSAATLMIDIAADVAKLVTGFKQAENTVQAFGKRMQSMSTQIKVAVAGIATGMLISKVATMAAQAGDLGEQAEAVGLATDEFQALQLTMQQAGVSSERTGAMMARAANLFGSALEGDKASVERLRDLGVNILDAKGAPLEFSDNLVTLAKAISGVEDPMKRVTAARAVFGREGAMMIPTLQQLAAGFDAIRQSSQLGVLSPEAIKNFDSFFDRLTVLQKFMSTQFLETLNNVFASPGATKALSDLDKQIVSFAETLQRISKSDFGTLIGDNFSVILRPLNLIIANVTSFVDLIGRLPNLIAAAAARMSSWFRDIAAFLAPIMAIGPEDEARAKEWAAEQKRLAEQNSALAQQLALGRNLPLPNAPPPVTSRDFGGKGRVAVGLPGIKADADKLKQILDGLKTEFSATEAQIGELLATSKEPTKDAERIAKMGHDIAVNVQKFTQQTNGVGADEIKKWVTANEEAKVKLAELQDTIKVATDVRREWGDGTRELTEFQLDLNKALAAGLITQQQYNDALLNAQKQQEMQALSAQRLKEGFDGVAAGFAFAAAQWEQSQSAFMQGQQVFGAFIDVMNEGIDSLVGRSSKGFDQIAADFALMLAKMAAQAAVSQIFGAVLGSFGGALGAGGMGPPTPGTGLFGWLGGLFGGTRAVGGPVNAGRSYLVGENGPERFIPAGNGRIMPNDGSSSVSVGDINISGGSSGGDAQTSMELGRRVKAAVIDTLQNEQRPGGILYGR